MTARALPALAACLALASSGGDTAHAGLVLPPLTSLPSVRGVPGLWFDGAHPEEIAALRARAEHPRTAAHLEAIEDFVDAHLDPLAGADDETRAELALGAALLTVLDRVPPAGTGFASYRDASVAALRGIGNRQAVDDVVEVFWRPADAIDLVRDTSLLSSMAQAYDLLAGSGVGAQDDAALRALLARWANALRDDWNLRGGPGVTARRDTWGIKAGASLLSAALALPDHPDAESWRAAAMTYLQGSLALVAGATGWYTEGAWYLGHALATLVPCAWHVRHATGVDWFGALRPLVTTAFALRQPDGRAPPLEDGLGVTFPWDVLAAAYPELGGAMLWAWEHSPRDAGPFDEHHLHDVTRFIVADLASTPAPPDGAKTRFAGDPANLVSLRSAWHPDALMATSITARDHATTEALIARHHTRNPLDLVVHGAGRLVMPTASGGPRLAASTSRLDYLQPGARNLPLIDGTAPFVRADDAVTLGDRLDSEDDGAHASHYLDLASTTLTDVYEVDAIVETSVTRTVAMVDERYLVVMDRQRLDEAHAIDLTWRGRGTRSARAGTPSVQRFSWAGPGDAGPRLDLDVVSTHPLASEGQASLYADGWDREETIDAVRVGAVARAAAFISVIQIGDAAARVVTPIGDASVAAATVTDGVVVDTLLHNPGDASVSAGAITTDARAVFVRTIGGSTTSVGAVGVRSLALTGGARLAASAAATLALMPVASGLVVEVSSDRVGPFDLTLAAWPGLDRAEVYEARLEGTALPVTWSDGALVVRGVGGGTLVIAPAPCRLGSGEDGDGDRYCGSADVCPTLADDQRDADGDGVGDACECLEAAARCDDHSPCTEDRCDPTTGACTHVDADGPCDDGDACTSADRCRLGACLGEPRACDDGVACTRDACVEGACVSVQVIGQACDDGDACTTADVCDASGRCVGVAATCDDGNACTQERCEAGRGCVVSGVVVGAACDDGSVCTDGDRCDASGACVGEAVRDCDDGDPCTVDRCDPRTGCEAIAAEDGHTCEDGARCTIDDRCVRGVCVGDAVPCDDGNPCTTDGCDPVLGCVRAPLADGAACDDGNACTRGDGCNAGSCAGVGVVCDDGDPCTVDTCAEALGCLHEAAADGVGCDDGDACTDADACRGGVCTGAAAACDDLDPCTRDRCEAEVGCVAEAMADGSACGAGRVCREGACVVEADVAGHDAEEAIEGADIVEQAEVAEPEVGEGVVGEIAGEDAIVEDASAPSDAGPEPTADAASEVEAADVGIEPPGPHPDVKPAGDVGAEADVEGIERADDGGCHGGAGSSGWLVAWLAGIAGGRRAGGARGGSPRGARGDSGRDGEGSG